MKDKALIIKDLSVKYDKVEVLNNINLEIPSGKLTAIVGPNGAGKTTLIKTILNLNKEYKGEIIFPTLKQDKSEKKCEQIAYVPQSESVDWDFPTTVLDVVIMGRYGHLGLFKRVGMYEKELAMKVLKEVGMAEYANRQIRKLSGGQQQRVFLARAVIQDAKIYLMDEPFKGVDAKTQNVIVDMLKRLKEQGKTIVIVHHELQTVKEFFDWVILVNKTIIANGDVDDVFTQNNINSTYAIMR